MTSKEIREKFIEYFKRHGHAIVPSSSLIPDDPSVLLTTAGMQQFKKYYTGEKDAQTDFGCKNTASIQKSFRTSDIDEVGDASHLTFFEMLGNFSFGGYFKKEAITLSYEFITKELELPISYVTIFTGSQTVPKDEESRAIWKSLGVQNVIEEGMEDVFWGPTGSSGPCGPTTEIYCKNADGVDVEIWNIVFNQFFCTGSRQDLEAGNAELKNLDVAGIDTGMGFERLAMISQGTKTIFETDLFTPLAALMTGDFFDERRRRIFADHIRASMFLITDGIRPSNKGAGYILRRLIRRMIALNATADFNAFLHTAVEIYKVYYPEILEETVSLVFNEEKNKFEKTVVRGLHELKRIDVIDCVSAFKLYESYGLPYETIKEFGGDKALQLNHEGFDEEFRKHQEISRAGLEKKFGGHGLLLDTGELKAKDDEELKKVTRLHTATHLLQQALRMVLGEVVHQAGSDITVERTRFDFTFTRKVTEDELRKTEAIMNDIIAQDLSVSFQELPIDEAKKTGALYYFKEKYPEKVKVYYVGNSLESAFSKEFCGGPHVTQTGEIGIVKIMKEEACSAGIRRIRAVIQ